MINELGNKTVTIYFDSPLPFEAKKIILLF